MAYQIDRYNNTLLTVLEDGTLDQTTDLKLVGKNYAGYGEIQNENFVFLLESFSGANQPARPVTGQVWFDSGNSKLKFYDGVKFRTTGGSEININEPTGLAIGDFWWDSGNDQLFVYNGISYILIGPQNASNGITAMQSVDLLDSNGASRSVIVSVVENETVFIISPSEFDLNISTPVTGFDRIKKGLTLAWTMLADNGVTNSTQIAGNDFNFWGTASNSQRLGGVEASAFVQIINGQNTIFQSPAEFPDGGIFIGDSQDLQIHVENGTEGVIQNNTGQNSIIGIKTTDNAGLLVNSVSFTSSAFKPSIDNAIDCGTASLQWKDIHAARLIGEATQSTSLRVGSEFRNAAISATPNTVAVRDATGNLSATLFDGTATSARYADLAEKYSTNVDLPTGTVVSVCKHESHDVEAASPGNIAIGVVSAEPAFMMNSEAEGQYIGLKGRVPVRVIGPVKKGQLLYPGVNGTATVELGLSLVGVALESNASAEEKLVECVLKV